MRAIPWGLAIVLPDFLVPAFSTVRPSRPFSSTSKYRSRIGKAPVSIPAEVDLRILEPVERKNGVVKAVPTETLEIQGPLGLSIPIRCQCCADHVTGKMTVQLPPYMSINHNKETRKASLSILDREERKQREMWGVSTRLSSLHFALRLPDSHRYNSRISQQSHPWCLRRSYRDPETSRSGIPSDH